MPAPVIAVVSSAPKRPRRRKAGSTNRCQPWRRSLRETRQIDDPHLGEGEARRCAFFGGDGRVLQRAEGLLEVGAVGVR